MKNERNSVPAFFSWDEFVAYGGSVTSIQRQEIFERLTESVLVSRPEYRSMLKSVWSRRTGIPKNISSEIGLTSFDEKICFIAETLQGDFWVVQSRYKDPQKELSAEEIFAFDRHVKSQCQNVSGMMLIHSGEKRGKIKGKFADNYFELGLDFWVQLSTEDWKALQEFSIARVTKPSARRPRPHQKHAIDSAIRHFLLDSERRGKLIMPCGTGKSLTAFWIAKTLNAKTIVVVVPSLALIKQSLEDWAREFIATNESPSPQWKVVCSDSTAGKLSEDEFVTEAYALGIPTTTNIDEIGEFLGSRQEGRKIIFTTYQSSDKIAQASRKYDSPLDLAILDEAHKTVGGASGLFSTFLSDENVRIEKRVFMTATERIIRGNREGVFSMDDQEIYGTVFYQLSFKEAIHSRPPIICDYKILTIGVSNEEIRELIQNNNKILDIHRDIDEEEAQAVASAIALRKSTIKYGIKHAVSFHKNISRAKGFENLNAKLNSTTYDNVQLDSFHVNSASKVSDRTRSMKEFRNSLCGVITNARCLTEGVDVPAVDCVLFADPKHSMVDIVQAVGRALRPYSGKTFGYILLPIVVPEGEQLNEFLEGTAFRQIARVLSVLSVQDERIVAELRNRQSGDTVRERIIEWDEDIPATVSIGVQDVSDKIFARIWERVATLNWRPFREARDFVHTLSLKSENQWRSYCQSGNKPADIPSNPNLTYAHEGYINMGDWLGTYTIAPRNKEFRSYEEAKTFVQNLKLKNRKQWNRYCASGEKPVDIPSNPEHLYKDAGYVNYGDWLGTGTIATHQRKYLKYQQARKYVRSLNLKSVKEWNDYCKSGDKPYNIPSSPAGSYKDKGWAGYPDWLGTNAIPPRNRRYLPFEEARRFVRKLGLGNREEWITYSRSGNKPAEIPASPRQTYKDKGWIGIGDWLGTGIIAKQGRTYMPFKEARAIVRKLKLKNRDAWNEYCRSGGKPSDLPYDPSRTYKDTGWNGWGDWLGTGNIGRINRAYRSFDEARSYVHRLNLRSKTEWKAFCKSGKRPEDIPVNPNQKYKNDGWKGFRDWLGENT